MNKKLKAKIDKIAKKASKDIHKLLIKMAKQDLKRMEEDNLKAFVERQEIERLLGMRD